MASLAVGQRNFSGIVLGMRNTPQTPKNPQKGGGDPPPPKWPKRGGGVIFAIFGFFGQKRAPFDSPKAISKKRVIASVTKTEIFPLKCPGI